MVNSVCKSKMKRSL